MLQYFLAPEVGSSAALVVFLFVFRFALAPQKGGITVLGDHKKCTREGSWDSIYLA